MKEKTMRLYEYLYRITSSNKYFKFNPKGRDAVILNNFIEKLTESHGEDWLFNYLVYQFSRYYDLDTFVGKGKVMAGWVFGEKALKKFREASSEELFYSDKFKEEMKIKNILFESESISVEVDEYKHKERMRFHSTDAGLIHCKTMGDLYNPKHKDCMFCKFKEWCK